MDGWRQSHAKKIHLGGRRSKFHYSFVKRLHAKMWMMTNKPFVRVLGWRGGALQSFRRSLLSAIILLLFAVSNIFILSAIIIFCQQKLFSVNNYIVTPAQPISRQPEHKRIQIFFRPARVYLCCDSGADLTFQAVWDIWHMIPLTDVRVLRTALLARSARLHVCTQ